MSRDTPSEGLYSADYNQASSLSGREETNNQSFMFLLITVPFTHTHFPWGGGEGIGRLDRCP